MSDEQICRQLLWASLRSTVRPCSNSTPHQPRSDGKVQRATVHPGQLSVGTHGLVGWDSGRPVWTEALLAALDRRLEQGQSVSPPDYPHAAEDVLLALTQAGALGVTQPRTAVWSSISPWLESALLRNGVARRVLTVDYNAPRIDARGDRLMAMELGQACSHYCSRGSAFDLIVSFSGIEHDGLGRYHDPLDPDGDLAAMREVWLQLRPGGVLLLGVPTSDTDATIVNGHRLYGPTRLPLLIRDFELVARVWDGHVVRGGLERANETPTLWYGRTGRVMRRGFAPRGDWGRSRHPGGEYWDWQHQPVLVLRKPKRRAAEMLPGWVAKWSAAVQEGRCKQMPDWHVRP